MTSTALARKGMRQPQSRNAASSSRFASSRKPPTAHRYPTGGPSCGEWGGAAEALPEAQQAEQGGSYPADHRVAGQNADQRGGNAHHQERGDQGCLAPDAIAEVPEQQRAKRTRDEGDAESEEGVQRLHRRVAIRKKQRPDHHCHRESVDVEIVELDGGADETGEGDACDRGCHDELT